MNFADDTQGIRPEGWLDQDREEGQILSGEPEESAESPSREAIKILSGITVIIYALIDPRTGLIRYIGKTTRPLSVRLGQHLRSLGKNIHRSAWIKSLLAQGLKPIIEEIERIENSDDADWQESERFWITYFRLISAALKGRFVPPDQREKMRIAALRRWGKLPSTSHSSEPNPSAQTVLPAG